MFNILKLTTDIFDWTADSINIDWSAALHLESTLLHDTGCMVLDAVAQVTGVVGVTGDLHTIHVELTINITPTRGSGHGQCGQVSHLSVITLIFLLLCEEWWWQCCAGPDINRN